MAALAQVGLLYPTTLKWAAGPREGEHTHLRAV